MKKWGGDSKIYHRSTFSLPGEHGHTLEKLSAPQNIPSQKTHQGMDTLPKESRTSPIIIKETFSSSTENSPTWNRKTWKISRMVQFSTWWIKVGRNVQLVFQEDTKTWRTGRDAHIQPNLHRSFEMVVMSTLKLVWYAVPEIFCRNLIEIFWIYGLSATLFLKKWRWRFFPKYQIHMYLSSGSFRYRQDKILELLR